MAVKHPQEPFTRITVEEAREMMSRDDVVVIDVREPHEYQAGHVPGAKLIPVGSVFARRHELPQDKDIIFVCAVGQRSALACEMAAAAGLTRLYNLEGGTDAWIKAGLPVEK
ncbi:MAG: rhodanese-like domain-containing protein [Dehalococcoidia bacterium]|jgi:rhodanese-related sulfurtransferase|nr:rhodanese-like domain-containing protein [Dehalococcoidia bacterium]MDW8008662.1 rhodanese-like domain-containing protein [Chloroflexota bacterium]